MYEVNVSPQFQDRFLNWSDDLATTTVALLDLLRRFGIDDVSLVIGRGNLVFPDDQKGDIKWIAFRMYVGEERASILAFQESDGSITIY